MAELQCKSGRADPNRAYMGERPIVAIRYGGRRIGLYRVEQVGDSGMRLNHGGISFPVGTRLDVEDIQHLFPLAISPHRTATVIGNTPCGLDLAWQPVQG